MKTINTMHSKRKHSALNIDGTIIVPAQPTEIALVLELKRKGYDMTKAECTNTSGAGFNLLHHWVWV